MATHAQREHMKHLMDLSFAHKKLWLYPPHDVRGPLDARTTHYSEGALTHVLEAGHYVQADCSEWSGDIICRLAGLHDPSGTHYRYASWTGSMLEHLGHLAYEDPHKAGLGALVIFGPGTGEHVALVYEPGKDPLLQGHGRAGMDRWRLSQERTWHRAPVRFLPIAHL